MFEPGKDYSDLPCAKIALQFATLICEEKYDDAHKMLSEDLKKTNSPEGLRQTHRAMLAYLEDEDNVDEEDGEERHANGEKPEFEIPQDYLLNVEIAQDNWAYCSIRGEDYSEAVSVSVIPGSDEDGDSRDYVISRLDWGRP